MGGVGCCSRRSLEATKAPTEIELHWTTCRRVRMPTYLRGPRRRLETGDDNLDVV